jgi:Phage tail tube protein
MAVSVKIDSNITGLRYCQEVSLGVLDGTAANQRWVELEPNSYSDFGGNLTTVARNPINPGRQRKKGSPVNVEATAGWDTDLTQENSQDILQGFFFANLRKKQEFTGSVTVATSDDSYGATGIHTGYFAGDLIFVTGASVAANNGLKNVATAAANKVTVSQNLVDEGPTAGIKLVAVGFQFGSGEVGITNSGSAFPVLTRTGGSKDLTQLGLTTGDWIYIGGDSAPTQFAGGSGVNNGFARVRSVTSTVITFDKTQNTMVTDNGATKTIQLFKGRVLKNEIGTNIIRRSYTLERTLGVSDPAQPTLEQAEYVIGSVPNEFTFNYKAADKLTCDLAFVGLSPLAINEVVSGANTLKSKIASVVRVPVVEADMFNTSSDISRVSLRPVSTTNANTTPLFTYSEEITVNINNNNSPNNAIGVFGAFEVTAGTFEVSGNITAYFGDVASVQAVQNNTDISLDIIQVKNNSGIVLDLPLLSLGGGLLNVEQDAPIKIPLEPQAATGAKIDANLNHTALMVFFDYLPSAAG